LIGDHTRECEQRQGENRILALTLSGSGINQRQMNKESWHRGPSFGLPLKGALQSSDLKVTKVQSATKVPKIEVSLRSIVGKK